VLDQHYPARREARAELNELPLGGCIPRFGTPN